MHKSVGAIISKNGKILMLDRANFPYGWACPAGHIEKGELPEAALLREVFEETNLVVKKFKLLTHEFVDWNECRKGVKGHDWYLYQVLEWEGEVKNNPESKNINWFDKDEIMEMQIENVWNHWFNKFEII